MNYFKEFNDTDRKELIDKVSKIKSNNEAVGVMADILEMDLEMRQAMLEQFSIKDLDEAISLLEVELRERKN